MTFQVQRFHPKCVILLKGFVTDQLALDLLSEGYHLYELWQLRTFTCVLKYFVSTVI